MQLRDVAEIVDPLDPLQIEAANRTEMPYTGWVEVPFKLVASDDESLIPMLLLKDNQQQYPIIGFNVIECWVLDSAGDRLKHSNEDKLVEAITFAFPHIRKKKVKAFINAVSLGQTYEHNVRTENEWVSVPAHGSVQVDIAYRRPHLVRRVLLFLWPEGLEFCDTVLFIKAGTAPKIVISDQILNSRDIF